MIDFVLFPLLVASSVILVRRVRQLGFEGLRPPMGFLSAFNRVAEPEAPADRPSSTAVAEPPARQTDPDDAITPRPWELELPPEALRPAPPVEPELPPAPPPATPAYALAWLAGVALVAVAIVLQARLWLNRENLTPLWGLLAVGVAFAVVVRVGLRVPAVSPTWMPSYSATDGFWGSRLGRMRIPLSWRRADRWLLGAVGAEVVALVFFERGALANAAWVLHFVATILFFGGIWIASGASARHLAGSWNRWDTIAVVAITLIGAVPRLWELGRIPEGVWFDEAQRGIDALRMLQDPSYRPVWMTGIAQEPAFVRYLLAPLLAVAGRDPLALRIPTVVAGILGVTFIYFLARVSYGRRTAIAAALIMAGLTWQLNYSRVMFPTMMSMTLDALAAAFLALGLKRKSAPAFAAAGLTAGAGAHFYYSSQLVPIIFVLIALHQLIIHRLQFLRDYWRLFVLSAIAFVLAIAPIAEFAVLHPREFMARADTVNVIKEVQQSGSWDPLIQSTKAHLLMFNAQGDNNGRHNWTGRPLLDEVTGALFILGLMLALTFVKRWEYALPLIWAPVMLLAGILSISWEAPQSHRTADEVTAVALLAALPLGALWAASDRLPRALLPGGALLLGALRRRSIYTHGISPVVAVLVILGLLTAGAHNVDTYFNKQMKDSRTWEEYNTPQTVAARELNAVPSTYKGYVDPAIMGWPSFTFTLKDHQRELVPFDPAGHLPVTEDSAVLVLTDRAPTVADRISDIYPGAERKLLTTPDGNRVGLYTYVLTPADIQATQGVWARYGPEDTAMTRTESRIDFAWPSSPPMPAPFPARLESTLSVPTGGPYRLRLEGPADATVLIDGLPVIQGGREVEVPLAKGLHTLRVDVPEAGTMPLRLLWAPPGREYDSIPARMLHHPRIKVTGLKASLFNGLNPRGQPGLEQIDPSVELRVHMLPLNRPYTIEWTGSILAPQDGAYRFGTSSVGASGIWINGNSIASQETVRGGVTGVVQLTAGWHDIRVQFIDTDAFSNVLLYWEAPGGPREIVPSSALRPWPPDRIAEAQPGDEDLEQARAALASRVRTSGPAAAASSGTGQVLADKSVLDQPRGLAVTPDGTVYVADAGKKAVVVLAAGEEPRVLTHPQFVEPAAVAVTRERSLIVVDAGAGALWQLDASTGALQGRLVPDLGFYGPRGVSVAPDGRIGIADTGNNRIVILSPAGTQPEMVGGLREPTDVAFLPDGSLLVAETGSKQITNVRFDGQRIGSWPSQQSYTVVGPHLAVLPRGGWIATEPEDRKLLRLGPNARNVQAWGADAGLRKPVGVAASVQGVVVSDADAGTVTRFPLP